jgi:hypothetical protein
MSLENGNKPIKPPEGLVKIDNPPTPGLSRELIKATAAEILHDISSLPGVEEYTDISEMYKGMPSEQLVVRRENPESLLAALKEQQPIHIQFVGDTPYANAVVWNPKIDGSKGMDTALLEGNGQLNGVVLAYGFEQPDGFYLEQRPESKEQLGGIDRSRVRTAAGFVPYDSVRFVTVRIPILGFPEDMMTEDELDRLWEITEQNEKDRKPAFIYRGYLFTEQKEEAAHHKMAA